MLGAILGLRYVASALDSEDELSAREVMGTLVEFLHPGTFVGSVNEWCLPAVTFVSLEICAVTEIRGVTSEPFPDDMGLDTTARTLALLVQFLPTAVVFGSLSSLFKVELLAYLDLFTEV